MAIAVWKASSAGAGLAGSRFSRISPRARCSSLRTRDSRCGRPPPTPRRGARGRVPIARLRLGLGQRDLQEPVEHQDVLFAQELYASAHVLGPLAGVAAVRVRPTLEKQPTRPGWPGHARARAGRVRQRSARRARGRRAYSNIGRVISSERERADMGEAREPRLSTSIMRDRAIDVAERP